MNSVGTIFWVCILLSMSVLIFAIPITMVVGQDKTGSYAYDDSYDAVMQDAKTWNNFQYFGTLKRSCYTLLMISIMAEWDKHGRALYEADPWMLLLFCVFIVVTFFGIMNVIIGAIVDNMVTAADNASKQMDEAEAERRRQLVDQLAQTVKDIDAQGDGKISLERMEQAGVHGKRLTKDLLASLPEGSASELLRFLDFDGSGDVTYVEFIEGLYSLLSGDATKHYYLLQIGHNSTKRMLRRSTAESNRRHDLTDEELKSMHRRLEWQEGALEAIGGQVSGLASQQAQ